MNINCLIIDDEPLAINVIENHLKQLDNVTISGTFTNPIKALKVLQEEKVDVIFLDINMPQMKGFTFIESLSYRPYIVFTTAYREYAVESFELDITDYLVKPISFERLLKTINKIFSLKQLSNPNEKEVKQDEHMFFKVNKRLVKIYLKDILYIESLKDYIKIITKVNDYVVHKSLSAITEELPSTNFIRIHRSYTIAIDKVNALEGNTIEIDGKKIPIGRIYLKETKDRIFNIKETKEN